MSEKFVFNNSDHFQLLIDYKIKREKGTANTSQLSIELEERIEKSDLIQYLRSNKHFATFYGASYHIPFIGKAKHIIGKPSQIEILEVLNFDRAKLNDYLRNDNIGARPVRIYLLHSKESSTILFQFNHLFIDNNGVKLLLRSFEEDRIFFNPRKQVSSSFLNRFIVTFKLAKEMLRKWYEEKAFIEGDQNNIIVKKYIIDTLTLEETEKVTSKILMSNRLASISSVLMAACCMATNKLLLERSYSKKEFLFQQPYDISKRKGKGPILGNRFSFIYYRLHQDQINDLNELQKELNIQTYDQLKKEVPLKFLKLQSILRLVNLRFHLWMISLPARGKMTSMAYSFIGETKVINTFAGKKIKDMLHIPPVMKKPPVTFGFVLYEGKLRLQICYDATIVNETEANKLHENLRSILI